MKPSVAIVGAGAVGMFYGAKLLRSGCKVEFQSRSSAATLRRKKLKIRSIWGDFSCNARVFDASSEMKQADVIILSTKVLPGIDYKTLIEPVLKKNSIIVCLQNGISQEDNLASFFSSTEIVGALAYTCISRVKEDDIRHLDYGLIKVGPRTKKDTKAAKLIEKVFLQAGIECQYQQNLRLLRWQKLLWNIPFNVLSVILTANTEQMMARKEIRQLSYDLMHEVKQIAAKESCRITNKEIDDMIERTRKMKPYKTSMLLDYEAQRSLEIEAILGKPLELAKKLKVSVPKMQTLYALLNYKGQNNE